MTGSGSTGTPASTGTTINININALFKNIVNALRSNSDSSDVSGPTTVHRRRLRAIQERIAHLAEPADE